MRLYFIILLLAFSTGFTYSQSELVFTSKTFNNNQIDSLKKALRKADESSKPGIYVSLIYALRTVNTTEAIELGNRALQLAERLGDQKGQADILTELGKCHHFLKDYTGELEFHNRALTLRQQLGNKTKIGISLNFIGQAYFDGGKYLEAFKYYYDAYNTFVSIGDDERSAITANDIGIVSNTLGNFEIALDFFLRAVKIKEKIATRNSRSATYANIGDVYINLKEYDDAVYYYRLALDNCEANIAESLIKIKLGNAYQLKNDIPKAYNLLFSSLANIDNNSSYAFKSMAYISIGKMFEKMNKLDSALIYLNFAYDNYSKYNSRVGKIETINAMVPILIKKKNVSLALNLLNSILPSVDSLNLKEKQRLTYANLAEVYELSGSYQSALNYWKKSEALRDTIFSIDKTRQIVSMQLFYQSEQKAKEIEYLRSENSYQLRFRNTIIIISILLFAIILLGLRQYYLKKKENIELEVKNRLITAQKEMLEETTSELRESIATKDKFFSIISHDLKNPFHSILSVSDLLAKSINKLSQETISTFATEMNKTASNAYKLLQNLLDWARLQRGKMAFEPKQLDVSKLVNEAMAAHSTNAALKQIKIISNVSEDISLNGDENMIMLIVSNLLSNAIKFSNLQGEITIGYEKTEGFHRISVADNGIGIEPEIINKLFKIDSNISTEGTARETGTGLGLILCKDMADRHNGKILVESEPGKGSTFTLLIPAN